MKIYISEIFDPYFNIATEEYLFKNFTSNIFLLYRNNPSIIIGKHQNAFAEINQNEIEKNNIPVIRRLSGGGTVFHDPGNINFSFIVNKNEGNLVDFKKHMQVVYNLLHELNVNAEFSKRNDLFIDGKKISGNAEHIFKKRVLHHGTILFSANLSNLSSALKTNPEVYKSKAIQSVRSEVTNIKSTLYKKLDIEDFIKFLIKKIEVHYKTKDKLNLTDIDLNNIEKLVLNKYTSWDWNYAYSPEFEFRKTHQSTNESLEVILQVKKGLITNAKLKSEHISQKRLLQLENKLIQKNYKKEVIFSILENWKIDESDNFINAFF